MKKAKEDALLTREDIIDAGFKCFDKNGFKRSSLDMIAKEAGVTRGAIYWHFKDKSELYREVVHKVLREADLSVVAHNMPIEWSYQKKIHEIFCMVQTDESKMLSFIYKTMGLVQQNADFDDLREAIQIEKINLFRYLVEETRIHIQKNGLTDTRNPEDYASALLLMFEGLFLMKNISVGLKKDREHLETYVNLIIKDLIIG